MSNPFISIIVPTYNAEKTVGKCIESLFVLEYSNYEIIIVDDDSTDKTKEILAEYKNRIRVIEERHSGPSRCRNTAVLEAKGEFIAFTDSDCVVDRNWLKELMKGFVDSDVVSVGGSQYSPADETEFGKRVQAFFELTGFLSGYIKGKNHNQIVEVVHNPSCNVMYRKKVFLEIGGFDEKLWPSEDVDLDYRLKKGGFIFMYNPKAIVYHYRPENLRQLSKMMYRYGIMQGILTKRYGLFRKIQFIPIFFLILFLLFIVNKAVFWLIPFYYLFLLYKTGNIIKSFFVFFFSVFCALIWSGGYLRGMFTGVKS